MEDGGWSRILTETDHVHQTVEGRDLEGNGTWFSKWNVMREP